MNHILDKFKLDGQVAVVTGGAGLLGKQFCRTLAQAGATVVVADLNLNAAEQAAETLKKEGLNALGVGVDVTSSASTQEMVAKTVKTLGTPGCASMQCSYGSQI